MLRFMFKPVNLLADNDRVHRAICTGTGGYEDQFQSMLPKWELTGIIPAYLVRTYIESFVDRCYQNIVHVNIHFSVAWTALVDDTEGLSRKLESCR